MRTGAAFICFYPWFFWEPGSFPGFVAGVISPAADELPAINWKLPVISSPGQVSGKGVSINLNLELVFLIGGGDLPRQFLLPG